MDFQALATFVLLEIPESALRRKFFNPQKGEEDTMELPSPDLENLKEPFKVISVGESVPPSIAVGDRVMMFLAHNVNVVTIRRKQYVLTQWYEINVKIHPDAEGSFIVRQTQEQTAITSDNQKLANILKDKVVVD